MSFSLTCKRERNRERDDARRDEEREREKGKKRESRLFFFFSKHFLCVFLLQGRGLEKKGRITASSLLWLAAAGHCVSKSGEIKIVYQKCVRDQGTGKSAKSCWVVLFSKKEKKAFSKSKKKERDTE